MTTTEIRPVAWASHGDLLAEIRREVFIDEQGVPPDLEWDGLDPTATHWLALVDAQPVGTVRLLGDGHVGRMAVRQPWRGQGVGRALMTAVLDHGRQSQHELFLHAQVDAIPFYERLGFAAEGPVFQDAGIPHRTMRLALGPRRLGQHSGRFAVADRAAVALELAQQATRQLRLLSNELEPALYDSDAFATALSALARGHRNSEIRLLVLDGRTIAQRGHRLLTLQRRLPSAIRIRRLTLGETEVPENFLIADSSGLLCFDVREPQRAWADFHNVPVAENYRSRFDDWWYRAEEDPELRQLSL